MSSANTAVNLSEHHAAKVDQEPTDNVVCLVGDRFTGMGAVPGVQTLSRLVGDLRRGAPVPAAIVIGQGLGDYELDYLHAALARREDTRGVPVVTAKGTPVARSLVHKHREQNVLLSDLRTLPDGRRQAALVVHGENELLLDHQTGQHVQGMIVAEAMRQMFIAVFEAEYGVHFPDRHYYVVWNSMSVTFESFLFPLPAEITCEIVEADVSDPERMTFRVTMGITQAGTSAARADVSFAAFDDHRIKRSELRRATSAVQALVADRATEVAW